MTKLEEICINLGLNYRSVYERLQANILKFRRDKIIDDYSILLNYLINKHLTLLEVSKILGISKFRTEKQLDLIKSHKHTDESFKTWINHKSDCLPHLELKSAPLRRFYITIKDNALNTSEIAFKEDFCKRTGINLNKVDYKVTKRFK